VPAAEFVSVYNTSKDCCLGEQIGIADTSRSRRVGLLGRQSLDPGSGLYIVPCQAIHTIGMAFPIDVIFINRKHKVVGVRAGVQPYRMTRIFWTALGVIELPSGTILGSRTRVGDQLKLDFGD